MPEVKVIKDFKQGQRTCKKGRPDEYQQSGYWLALTDPATGMDDRAAFLVPKYNGPAISVCEQAGVGSQVSVTYKESNGYKNIAKIEAVVGSPAPRVQPGPQVGSNPQPMPVPVPTPQEVANFSAESALDQAIKTMGMYLNAPERFKNMFKVTKVTPAILTDEVMSLAATYLEFLEGKSGDPTVASSTKDLDVPQQIDPELPDIPEDDIPF